MTRNRPNVPPDVGNDLRQGTCAACTGLQI